MTFAELVLFAERDCIFPDLNWQEMGITKQIYFRRKKGIF